MMMIPCLAVSAMCACGVSDASDASPVSRVEFLGAASLAGDDRDRSKLRTFVGTFPQSRLGSFGSGIDYTGADDLYLACDDRGPGDGAYEFRARVQKLRIRIDPDAPSDRRIGAELVATTLLADEQGAPLTGFVGGFDPAKPARGGTRTDPEGIRCVRGVAAKGLPAGAFFISEEYGPRIDVFAADGRRLRSLETPEAFAIAKPHQDGDMELPPANTRGRQANRGFEGLALAPDGSRLWAILQSPLIQDGALDKDNNRVGCNIRVLEMPVTPGSESATRQLVYPLSNSKDGVSEILAVDNDRFLVIERDGKGGDKAKRRGVYLAGASAAGDVSGIAALPPRDLPASVAPMTKTLLIDFMDPRFGLSDPARGGMPEKIEGLCFGPDLKDGRKTLIVTTDNDMKADTPTWIWVFAIEPGALGGAAPAEARPRINADQRGSE